jgi:excinuclease ABC subunit C
VPNRPDPIVLPRTAQGLYLVQRIRDEAHRFAVTYHQKVRSRRAVRSILDDIAGVGPARKRALLRKFGSVRAMQEAPVEELAAVGGVGAALAERIKLALLS